ncbi:MAG: carbonic anhydrase [Desulfovibrionaceae bacterium]|nr:carbonic anhydrase [Desulfovibrionaceae bacterium]
MEDIVTDFLCGFDSFQKDVNPQLLEKLRETQNPKALVIACSDSRVDPAILFSCSPGDIFVIRNVANIVPRYTPGSSIHGVSAAIEYAIVYLNVSHIILLGHSNCGGIASLYTEVKGEFIGPWVNILREVKEDIDVVYADLSEEERRRCCEMEAMRVSYSNLKTFPFIHERLKTGTLSLHTWFFDLRDAKLVHLDMEQELPIDILFDTL